MSSQLSAHAITAHTAMTRMSISRCSTLPVHRGSSSAEKCSTSFSTDIAVLPSLTKRKPARLIRTLDPTCPFHASPLGPECVNHLHVAVQQRVGPERFRIDAPGPAATLPHDQDIVLWSRFTRLTPKQRPLHHSIPLPSCSRCQASISCRHSMPPHWPRRSSCPVSTSPPLWISSAAT